MTTSTHTPTDEIRVGRERIRFKVTSEQSGGEVAMFEVRMPPGGGPPMLHRHEPFELYRVRSGELAIYLEGRDGAVTRTVAGPGSVVPIGAGLEHTVRNESDEEAEAVVVFSPGQPMERFARAAAELGRGGSPAADGVMAVAREHGIELTRSIDEALVEAPLNPGYLTLARFSGDPDRLLDDYRRYSSVMSGVGRDHGLILHAGAKTDEGFLVVNLWPSKESSEAAARDPRRLEVIERAEIEPEQIRREHHDVVDFIVNA
jgi:mannose-6-phosphate isomerase-like protein (cupin superfamily)